MRKLSILILLVCVPVCVALAADPSTSTPPRSVNGAIIEGTVQKATTEGLVVETPKGVRTYPWKYLSAGTRFRYERPLTAKK